MNIYESTEGKMSNFLSFRSTPDVFLIGIRVWRTGRSATRRSDLPDRLQK